MLEFVDFVIENVDDWRRGAHASLNLCSFLKFGLQSLQLGGTAHEHDGLHVGRLEMRILDLLVHIGDNLAGARNDIVDGRLGTDAVDKQVGSLDIQRLGNVFLHGLSLVLGGVLQTVHQVAGEVAAAERQRCHIVERAIFEDGDGGGFGTHIHEHTTQGALLLGENGFGHRQRGDEELLHAQCAQCAQCALKVEFECGFSHYAVKLNVDATAAAAHRVGLLLVIDIISLWHNIDRLIRSDRLFECAILQVFDILLRNRLGNVEVAVDFGGYRMERSSVDAYIHICDVALDFVLKFLHNTHDSVFSVLHILHAAVAHAVGKFLFFEVVHAQVARNAFLGNGTHYFGAADFNRHDMLVILHKCKWLYVVVIISF